MRDTSGPRRRRSAARSSTASRRVAIRPGTPRPALPPAPLLMNGIAPAWTAQPFTDALSPHTAVIRFDVPGVGGSPLPRHPYRFTGLKPPVANMLTALGHQKADVLGISWGGGLAQHFAAFQRGRCRGFSWSARRPAR